MDAARLGVETATLVRLSNARGSVLLRAQITERQRRGAVFAPIHWNDQYASDARVGALVAPVVDPVSGQPESKATPVAIEAVSPIWYAFALTRKKPDNLDCGYWALARADAGWRCELAGIEPVADWEFFARKIFGLDADEACDFTAMRDARGGAYRCVAAREGKILGALFVAPAPVAVARAWACEQFAQEGATPLALLAGRPPRACRDPGKKICVCLNVGANTILDAIRDENLSSADAVAQKTGAGSGCGSCKPEIERLLEPGWKRNPAGSGEPSLIQAKGQGMKLSDLKQSGHWPTLMSAFLYFDISFMAWVSLGPLMAYIAKAMNIPIEQKLTLVAIPVLSGAILRIPLGILADTIGSKLTGTLAQIVMTLGLRLGVPVRPERPRRRGGVRRAARPRRRLLRRGAAAGQPLVSAQAAGRGDGHRRRRQHGRGARHPVRADHRRTFWLAGRLRRRCWSRWSSSS